LGNLKSWGDDFAPQRAADQIVHKALIGRPGHEVALRGLGRRPILPRLAAVRRSMHGLERIRQEIKEWTQESGSFRSYERPSSRRAGMAWKAPKIVEVPVGMEINMYACAARK